MNTEGLRTQRLIWVENADDLRRHARDLVALVDQSVADDGMLGYAAPLSAAEADALTGTWATQIGAGTGHIVIVSDEHGVCGMVYLRTNANANYRHIADLSKGYLAPRIRGGGTMRELFRALCRRGRELEVELFTLDTREESRAAAVWQHFGFTTWGVLDDYSRAFGRSHRGAYMSQTLDSLETILARNEGEGA